MAKLVLTDAYVVINSVNLSNNVQSVEVPLTKDKVEVTGMGSTSKEYLPGLGDADVNVTFLQDFAAAKVDATLYPLFLAGSQFPIEVRPTSATPSATNPKYTGTVTLFEYSPINGNVGDASTMSVTFSNSTQAGIVRGTA